MTGSPTLDFILALVILAAGGWVVWRGPISLVRVLATLVVVVLALAACGILAVATVVGAA